MRNTAFFRTFLPGVGAPLVRGTLASTPADRLWLPAGGTALTLRRRRLSYKAIRLPHYDTVANRREASRESPEAKLTQDAGNGRRRWPRNGFRNSRSPRRCGRW